MNDATDSLSKGRIDDETRIRLNPLFWVLQVVFIVVLVVVLSRWTDWEDFLERLLHMEWWWLVATVLLQIATYSTVTMIWRTVLARSEAFIPFRRLFSLSVMKLFIDQTLPSFGLSGAAATIKAFLREGASSSIAATTAVIEAISRYVPYMSFFLLAIFFAWTHGELTARLKSVATVFIAVIAILAVGTAIVLWYVLKRHEPGRFARPKILADMVRTLSAIPERLLRDARLWTVAILGNALIFLFDALTLWTILRSIAPVGVPFSLVFSAFMVSSVVATLALIPGGIGAFEGGAIGTLVLFGIPLEEALAATVLYRGFTYWLPMIPGFFIARRELRA